MDFDNTVPIYIQIIEDLKKQIIKGTIQPGDKLPSTRELALKYDINPNTSQRIYREMELDKICFTKRGLGTFVTEDSSIVPKIKDELATKLTSNFIEGMKDLGYSKSDLIIIINSITKI